MTDIREQILEKHCARIMSKAGAIDGHIQDVFPAMDEYALLVLEYVRKDYNFSETYITDLKSYLEEIKNELK